MHVKVVKKFIDVHTKEVHKVDEVMEVTKERYEEILKTGKFVKEIRIDTKVGEVPKGTKETV